MMNRKLLIVRRAVFSRRNSVCASAKFSSLDENNWWTDTTDGACYLHVAGNDGETSHRVFCRHRFAGRLKMDKGKLFWIFEQES